MSRPRRILIAEDEYVIAVDLERALKVSGIEPVGPVAGVDDGLRLIEANEDIDGAVIDINLRGERAYPIADALLARGIHFVFATGYDRSSIPAAYGKIALYGKPVEPRQIVAAFISEWTAKAG